MILRIRTVTKIAGVYYLHPRELITKDDDLLDGKVTLSLKYKKRRRLVSGRLEVREYVCKHTGVYSDYIFFPNNPEKFASIIGR